MPKHAGGRPTKLTEEMTEQICEAISLGMPDRYVADLVGVEYSTLFRWKQKPAFANAIKTAVATRQLVRLKRVESAEPGWQAASWSLERQCPERFARPEIQIQIANQQVSIRDASPNPFLSSEAEIAFIKQIVDEQPEEVDHSPPQLEPVPDIDLAEQRERDRKQIEEWRHGPVYEKPRLMPPSEPPAPSEPVNPKLQSVRLPNQQELAAMREDAARAAKVQAGDQKRMWVAGKPTPETRGDVQPMNGVY
jgi:hypothetical protein